MNISAYRKAEQLVQKIEALKNAQRRFDNGSKHTTNGLPVSVTFAFGAYTYLVTDADTLRELKQSLSKILAADLAAAQGEFDEL